MKAVLARLMLTALAIAVLVMATMVVHSLGVQTSVAEKTIRVYMIQDTEKGVWYRRNALNLVAWSAQDQGSVWTGKKQAVSANDALLSRRVTKVRAFVLLSVADK